MHQAVLRAMAAASLLLPAVPIPTNAAVVHVYAFDIPPATGYQIAVNGAAIQNAYSATAGSLDFAVDAVTGDVVSMAPTGEDLQPPVPPLFTSLDANGSGCAHAAWLPSGDPTVVGYAVSYGHASVAAGDAPDYEQSMPISGTASADVCQLPQGTYYFAVRARNAAGMLSGYSAERSVQIVVVSVLISMFDARPGEDGVRLSWRIEADELVQGFRVYRTGPLGTERAVSSDLVPPGSTSFLDRDVESATSYVYVLAAVRENGDETRSFSIGVQTPALSLALDQNVPNPFNPRTTIPFVLDVASRVRLGIYDVRGIEVARLFDGMLSPGRHEIAWDGRDRLGRLVSSGPYFYALVAGNHRLSRKMVLLK
jgi:FlgD Ig-like domain